MKYLLSNSIFKGLEIGQFNNLVYIRNCIKIFYILVRNRELKTGNEIAEIMNQCLHDL